MVQGQYTANDRSAATTFAERDTYAKQAGFQALQRKCSSSSSSSANAPSLSSSVQSKTTADRTNVWGRFQNVSDFKNLHNY